MSTIGIIANPASGKDIRRLVTHASVFDNLEKSHILRRVFLAIDALGVPQVLYMPDYDGLVEKALKGLKLSLKADQLHMDMWADERDTTEAARQFCEMDVGCIITLGGDGTNRAVAKACSEIPIVAISTGTNNVFPSMIEGTVAGMAAGMAAREMVDVDRFTYVAKRLEVYVDDQMAEIALIDVVVCTELFVGSRALWDPHRIREIVLARAEPDCIGMSCIGGLLHPLGPRDPQGMYVRLGGGNTTVLAPVGPGLISKVDTREYRLLSLGEEVVLEPAACTIAVDGERQLEVFAHQKIRVRLTNRGPRVVDVRRYLYEASRRGVLRTVVK
ncbi:MAG: NAD(+)/NADH kinase [Desulfobacterales bacterium]|nr:MAG: NAD(+)/NADH kinase [Desulfobacterales bacterium]